MGPREEATYDAKQPVESLNDPLKNARKLLKKAQKARKKDKKSANHPEARPGKKGRSPTPHPRKGKQAQDPPQNQGAARLAPAPWAGGATDQQLTQQNQTWNAQDQRPDRVPAGPKKKWWSGAWSSPRKKQAKGKGKSSKKGRGKRGKSSGKTSGKGRR